MDIIFILGKCNFDWLRTIDNSVIEDDQRLAQLLSFLRTAVNVGVLYCIVYKGTIRLYTFIRPSKYPSFIGNTVVEKTKNIIC